MPWSVALKKYKVYAGMCSSLKRSRPALSSPVCLGISACHVGSFQERKFYFEPARETQIARAQSCAGVVAVKGADGF